MVHTTIIESELAIGKVAPIPVFTGTSFSSSRSGSRSFLMGTILTFIYLFKIDFSENHVPAKAGMGSMLSALASVCFKLDFSAKWFPFYRISL
jgi:hypothetical protein